MSKKIMALFLIVILLLSSCAQQSNNAAEEEQPSQSAEQEPAPESEVLLRPGTYKAIAKGHNNDFEVTVVVDDSKIKDIIIGENYESGYIGVVSMNQIRDEIISRQSVNVDMVSGATVSSGALVAAVKDALKQAGGDLDKFNIPAEKDSKTYEDVSVQVVVIGSGSAGLAAAVEASELGMDVVLVEQLGILGGSSVRTGYLMAGGTILQEEANIDYSTEDFIAYITQSNEKGTGGGNRSLIDPGLYQEATAKLIGSEAGKNIEWLKGLGVEFNVGNTNQFRGPNGRLGPFLVTALHQALDNNGVDYRLNTRADELLIEDGKVIGVRVEAPNETFYNIYADAVILCTGGYNASQDMVKKYNPTFAGYPTDVCKGADGSGMLMAEKAGAVLKFMEQGNYHSFALLWRGASRSLSSVVGAGAIVVNSNGKRFVNEDTYYDVSAAEALIAQEGGYGYTILDQTIIDKVVVPGDNHLSNHITMYEVGNTPEELAEKLGIDPEGLAKTISDYASYVQNGEDTELGRSSKSMLADYKEGPYYGAKTMPETHTNHGGVTVDIDAHVLNANGKPIPGLYAAGEIAASHVLGATTNTVCIANGRIAARTALSELDK